MKKLLITLAVTLFSLNANALFLQTCYNSSFGNEAVSFSYQSCINRNFREIEREIREPIYLQHCSNIGDRVQYFYTSCINRNFREIERKMDNPIFLSLCSNFNPDRLDFSFESCVNRNYRNIERELR